MPQITSFGRPDHWHFSQRGYSDPDQGVLRLTHLDADWLGDAPLVELTLEKPTPKRVAWALGLPSLKRLKIIGYRKELPLESVAGSALEELVLFKTGHTSWLGRVAGFPKLRSFMLSDPGAKTSLADLSLPSTLRCLVLEGGLTYGLNVGDLEYLAAAPALEHLMLNGFLSNSSAWFEVLTRLVTIQTLWINPACCTLEQWAYLNAALGHKLKPSQFYFIQQGGLYQGGQAVDLERVEHLIGETLSLHVFLKGIRDYEGPKDKVIARAAKLQDQFESALVKAQAIADPANLA